MKLPVNVTFHPETETPQSLASRLARAMRFPSVSALAGERGILSFVKGERGAISQLSNWSGVSKQELLRFAVPTRNDAGEWRLGDAVFRKETKAVRFRYCPHCLTDDVENGTGRPEARAFERASWISRAVTSCTKHGNLLVEAPEEAPKNDVALFV